MCVESGHMVVKELEVKIAEIEGNGAEEKAKDLQTNHGRQKAFCYGTKLVLACNTFGY